jgi:hypothetical protein
MSIGENILSAENEFWKKLPKQPKLKLSNDEIDAKYDSKSERIITETNREKLQNFFDSLKRPGYMNPRPFYQRRQRWDAAKQSQLIESFLINIPIPPLFVYEVAANTYEVMDGQQRIAAISAFYSNELVLEGLERWPELNGKTYNKLPPKIRAGIDRRSISWVTVLHESSDSAEDAFAIKQLVFERLNTGGVRLSPQEIRNALYAGRFNQLLIELSKLPEHRKAWNLASYSTTEDLYVPDELAKKSFYLEMDDIEVILRFFALRNVAHYSNGMRGFLDIYMEKAQHLDQISLQSLCNLYTKSIRVATNIYEELIFKQYQPEKQMWSKQPQKAIADAVLIGLTSFIDQESTLVKAKVQIVKATQKAFEDDKEGILTGRGNTKKDVIDRIYLMHEIFKTALN